MENLSIALKPNRAALSSADYNKSPQNDQQPYSLVNLIADKLQEIEVEETKKWQLKRAAEAASEREEQVKTIKQAFEWKSKKVDNLRLVYAILANREDKIELAPIFEQQAFLEVVGEDLNPVELWLLADKVNKMSNSLNVKLCKITSWKNPDLFYQYHEYDKDFENVTYNHKNEPEVSYGAYVTTLEMAQMQSENKLLMNLVCELNNLTDFEPDQEGLEILKQALEAH